MIKVLPYIPSKFNLQFHSFKKTIVTENCTVICFRKELRERDTSEPS